MVKNWKLLFVWNPLSGHEPVREEDVVQSGAMLLAAAADNRYRIEYYGWFEYRSCYWPSRQKDEIGKPKILLESPTQSPIFAVNATWK